jgi:hypothetical protein
VVAIDALKRAQLESDARELDTREDHWPQTFGTRVGLNRCGLNPTRLPVMAYASPWTRRERATLSVTGVTGRCQLRADGDRHTLQQPPSRRCSILLSFEKLAN